MILAIRFSFFQMRRPGELHEDPHQGRGHARLPGVVREADGYETKEERLSLVPVPEVLVQRIDDEHEEGEEIFFHVKGCGWGVV